MPEVFSLCDTVSVLRDGKHVDTRPTAQITEADVVRMMIGRPLAEYFPSHDAAGKGEEGLRAEPPTSPGNFHQLPPTLRSGGVDGSAGLQAPGRPAAAGGVPG